MTKVLYPSCSELVTHLYITDIEEIRKALREITRITGYKVGVYAYVTKYTDIPLNSRLGVSTRKVYLEVDIGKVQLVNTSYGDVKLGIDLSSLSSRDKRKIGNKKSDDLWLVLYNPNKKDHLRITLHDSYCSAYGLTFECEQHCCTLNYPAFAKIIQHFGSIYHAHDGGSPYEFEDWCKRNDLDDVLEHGSY